MTQLRVVLETILFQEGLEMNILDGGIGSDVLDGNVGNDAYTIDNTNDLVIESSTISTEIDVVYSSVNYSLTANVEQLVLTGTANLNGTGNSLNNVIRGNAGNNTLNGGLGADQFQFSNKVSGIDTLGDFTTNVDKIVLSASGFGGGLVAGAALNITQLLKVTTGFAAPIPASA